MPVTFRGERKPRTEHITFDVVQLNYPYNIIFRRGTINTFDAVIRNSYLCMKIPAALGVITVKGNQKIERDIERGYTPGQVNMYNIEVAINERIEEEQRAKEREAQGEKNAKDERAAADKEQNSIHPSEETKQVLVDEQVLGQSVNIGTGLS